MTSVATTLRRIRTESNISQADLAARAGTSQPALARYETGVALPTLPTLERLLSACGRELQIEAPRSTEKSARATSMRGHLGPRAAKLRHHRRALLDAAQKRGLSKVRVFGSLARGEDGPESDIDFLVDLKAGRTLIDLAGFRHEATEILDIPVDIATVDMLKERIRDEVLAEALPI